MTITRAEIDELIEFVGTVKREIITTKAFDEYCLVIAQKLPALLDELETARQLADDVASDSISNFNSACQERKRAEAAECERDAEREKVARLREALELAECVYRKNCVAQGEPSSVLDAIQSALKDTAP